MAKRKRHQTAPLVRVSDADAPAKDVRRSVRVLCLLAGLILPQLVLLGSSLWGGTILLPLDILAGEQIYLPRTNVAAPWPLPQDSYLADLVFQAEPFRQLTAEEVRAGRWPLWNPYSYAGHPLLAANQPQVLSPYRVIDYLWPSPVAVAWQALLKALVIGVGMYLFFRRAMGLHWLAAAVGAWGSPLMGTMVLSGGYAGSAAVSFLPWVLLAADAVARRPRGIGIAGLAVATAFTLLAGHAAFAGQVLLVGGVYFLARLASQVGIQQIVRRPAWPSLLAGAVGVLLGFLLSAPQTLPTVDYLRDSRRIAQRQAAGEETAPSGPSAVVQMVLPYAFGSTQRGSEYIGGAGNRIESAAGGYAGLLFALVLAPLGWADRSRRRWMLFWFIVVVLGITPTVGIPLLSSLFEVPPVSLLRNNRLVFAAALALIAMAAVGVHALLTDPASVRRWPARLAAAISGILLLCLAVWCLMGTASTPLADFVADIEFNPFIVLWPENWSAAALNDVVSWFGLMYRNGVVICFIGLGAALALHAWLAHFVVVNRTHSKTAGLKSIVILCGVLAIAEMVSMSAGVNVRTDPSLYYPRLAWMDAIEGKPGRICGYGAFPANLSVVHRQYDIRGYDAADPVPIVELVALARVTGQPVWPEWAVTQFLSVDPKSPSPVANLLGVRHILGRGEPLAGVSPWWAKDDHWLAENPRALPRITLPKEARVIADGAARLATLSDPAHDPAAVVLLETMPSSGAGGAEGTMQMLEDYPGQVRIEVNLTRGGIVRLADAWDRGWRVAYNGEPIELLRADHALRAVVVPAGRGVIEFTYAPASFRWGMVLGAIGLTGIAGACASHWVRQKAGKRHI